MNMKPLEGSWQKQSAMEAAQNRVMDALEANRTPKASDLKTGRLCESCHGYGGVDDDPEVPGSKIDCPKCGGDGLAADHPGKSK